MLRCLPTCPVPDFHKPRVQGRFGQRSRLQPCAETLTCPALLRVSVIGLYAHAIVGSASLFLPDMQQVART